jgi:hypothetical protein
MTKARKAKAPTLIGMELKIPKGRKFAGRIAKIIMAEGDTMAVELRNGLQCRANTEAVFKAIEAYKPTPEDQMVTVYRIEYEPDGEGCYQRFNEEKDRGFGAITGSTIADERHPHPSSDSLLQKNLQEAGFQPATGFLGLFGMISYEPYRFGFASIEQLRAWMFKDSWLTSLADQNYILAVCKVPAYQVLVGNTQCVFIRPEIYEKKNLREFFNL